MMISLKHLNRRAGAVLVSLLLLLTLAVSASAAAVKMTVGVRFWRESGDKESMADSAVDTTREATLTRQPNGTFTLELPVKQLSSMNMTGCLTGIAIGVLICFLGGLMAVDIVPRKATGAALGVVGMTSYIAAGIQDVASGWLIDSNITVAADGVKHYDFGPVAIFWLAAAVISFLLPLLNRGKVKEF